MRVLILGLAISFAASRAHADKPVAAAPKPKTVLNPAPRPKDWAALAKLPDWSGVWNPNISDQNAQVKSNPTPWKPEVVPQIQKLEAAEKSGNPKGLFVDCLPEAMPSWMLITHNALEILYTPGRVTILGESDGNRLRRIYTDGRAHPEDPDPTFHGHSIGRWEGETLVVDTVGILPQSYLAVSESVGVPNNGDLHIVERWHLAEADILVDEIEITAPHVLSKPWKTTRKYFRQRARKYDLMEGVCLQGYFSEKTDADGNAIFEPIPQTEGGNPVPPEK
ncbi:MAG: hypothetical protein ABW352_21825 [Polyangiales bacterium]